MRATDDDGRHDALRMSSFFMGAIARTLREHPVVEAKPEWAPFRERTTSNMDSLMKHRSDSTTFGTFNDDVLTFKDPSFRRIDICSIIPASNSSR